MLQALSLRGSVDLMLVQINSMLQALSIFSAWSSTCFQETTHLLSGKIVFGSNDPIMFVMVFHQKLGNKYVSYLQVLLPSTFYDLLTCPFAFLFP